MATPEPKPSGQVPTAPSPAYRPFDSNRAKGRYGVTHVASLAAQAGVGFTETSADEDVNAVDGTINFPEIDVRVQIKCTSQFPLDGKGAHVSVTDAWASKWNDCPGPVFLILVIVCPEQRDWIRYTEHGTLHTSSAYWKRVNPGAKAGRMRLPTANRLSAETFAGWHATALAPFRPKGRKA